MNKFRPGIRSFIFIFFFFVFVFFSLSLPLWLGFCVEGGMSSLLSMNSGTGL